MDQKFWNTLLDRTSNALTQAAHVLGQATTHVYEVLVKQQVVEGVGTLVEIGFFGIITLIFWKILFEKYWTWTLKKERDASRGEQGMYAFGAAVITLGMLALIITGTVMLGDAVKHILNPEFYAIQYIFEQVNQAKATN